MIGPHASIGARCRISDSRIEDTILEADCVVTHAALKGSLIGAGATVEGQGTGETLTLNVGDTSTVRLTAAAGAVERPRKSAQQA